MKVLHGPGFGPGSFALESENRDASASSVRQQDSQIGTYVLSAAALRCSKTVAGNFEFVTDMFFVAPWTSPDTRDIVHVAFRRRERRGARMRQKEHHQTFTR